MVIGDNIINLYSIFSYNLSSRATLIQKIFSLKNARNHPNFFAYFGAGNAYPSVLGDMLSSGIAAIGFSWVCISQFLIFYLELEKRKNSTIDA